MQSRANADSAPDAAHERVNLQLATRLKQILEANGQINDAACRAHLKQLQQMYQDA